MFVLPQLGRLKTGGFEATRFEGRTHSHQARETAEACIRMTRISCHPRATTV
jgi:hypothetical protein